MEHDHLKALFDIDGFAFWVEFSFMITIHPSVRN